MPPPLAYFLTWTCYGQRLHGDERGTVDDEHNRRGEPLLPANSRRRRFEATAMKGACITLSPPMRPVVDAAICTLCLERQWRLVTLNVRSTHVHVIVNCRAMCSPEHAMQMCKSRGTRDLRDSGMIGRDVHPWAVHGSTRWLNHEAGLLGAIAYVNDWQSGPNKELLECKRALAQQQIDDLKAWLRAHGLPEHGRGVNLSGQPLPHELPQRPHTSPE